MLSKTTLALALEQLAHEHPFSGAILVAQGGEVLFEQAYGFASQQLRVPNALDTRFHIASMTKMFTAMTALILSEQGRLDLHEKPAAYLPELAALDQNITLHHLLSHTSGVGDIYEVPNLPLEMLKLKAEHSDLLPYLLNLPPAFRPGEGWGYSSTNFILLGYLMQNVTGVASFDELLRHHVLAPLSMNNTGHDRPRQITQGRAAGHAVEDGQLVNADNDDLSAFEQVPGECYSTVHDLKRWGDALFDCPLV
jgi:CubicO group peptidase (beta-lactamase class C family)